MIMRKVSQQLHSMIYKEKVFFLILFFVEKEKTHNHISLSAHAYINQKQTNPLNS